VRGRWSDGPNDFVAPTPRPGANLSFVDEKGKVRMAYSGPTRIDNGVLVRDDTPRSPARRPARHVHIYLPRPVRTLDQARPPAAVRRGGDQQQPALLCRISQDGKSGEWSGVDGNGRPLRVDVGANGLEVYTVPEEEAGGAGSKAGDRALLAPGWVRREGGDCAALGALQRLHEDHYPRSAYQARSSVGVAA
jgi:hypothetical protein